jgi:hypothetical protein
MRGRKLVAFMLKALSASMLVVAEFGVVLLATSAAFAAEAETPAAKAAPPPVVYLRGIVDLEKLRTANPNHYARAERIIAASEELCKPGPDQVYFASFDAKDISCQGAYLLTSYPPKREIGFTLDEVRYVALITVNDGAPRLVPVPAQPGK